MGGVSTCATTDIARVTRVASSTASSEALKKQYPPNTKFAADERRPSLSSRLTRGDLPPAHHTAE